MKALKILLCLSFRAEKKYRIVQQSLLKLSQSLGAELSVLTVVSDKEKHRKQEENFLSFKNSYHQLGGVIQELLVRHGSFQECLSKTVKNYDLLIFPHPMKKSTLLNEAIHQCKKPVLVMKEDVIFTNLACAFDFTSKPPVELALLYARALDKQLHINTVCCAQALEYTYPEKEEKREVFDKYKVYGSQKNASLRRETIRLSDAIHAFDTEGLDIKTKAFDDQDLLKSFWRHENIDLVFVGIKQSHG